MKPLYGFGLSQEDERTEAAGLALPGGDVLSVSSGGDMPLSLLALGADRVVAVDVDPRQLHLGELKRAAVIALAREDAIPFLGFLPALHAQRMAWLDRVCPKLPESSRAFWQAHRKNVARGAIWSGKYERYVGLVRALVAPIASRSFRALVSCDSLAGQQALFARKFDRPFLRNVFRFAFRPSVYGGRGVENRALLHNDAASSLGDRFFERFRDACTRSPARDNYLLQLHLMGKISGAGTVPEYLTETGFRIVRERAAAVSFVPAGIIEYLQSRECGAFDRFHLSNLPDWLSAADFDRLAALIVSHARPQARGVWRYLHRQPQVPAHLGTRIRIDHERSAALTQADRFPVYMVEMAEIGA